MRGSSAPQAMPVGAPGQPQPLDSVGSGGRDGDPAPGLDLVALLSLVGCLAAALLMAHGIVRVHQAGLVLLGDPEARAHQVSRLPSSGRD